MNTNYITVSEENFYTLFLMFVSFAIYICRTNDCKPLRIGLASRFFSDDDVIVFFQDNSGLFATSAGHVVEIWDCTRAHPTTSFNWDISQQHHVRFSGSEPNLLSSLDWDHNILLYDIRKVWKLIMLE